MILFYPIGPAEPIFRPVASGIAGGGLSLIGSLVYLRAHRQCAPGLGVNIFRAGALLSLILVLINPFVVGNAGRRIAPVVTLDPLHPPTFGTPRLNARPRDNWGTLVAYPRQD